MIVEYAAVRDDIIHPTRSNPSDAGLDVFFNPDDFEDAVIAPGENAVLATGLKFGIPHGYMLQAMNRSSVAVKRCLVVGAHCIDSGYDGEVFIDLHNIGNTTQVVAAGDKIAQLVMVPVIAFRPMEADEEELYEETITISDRGDGALGSTDEPPLPHPLDGMPSGF